MCKEKEIKKDNTGSTIFSRQKAIDVNAIPPTERVVTSQQNPVVSVNQSDVSTEQKIEAAQPEKETEHKSTKND